MAHIKVTKHVCDLCGRDGYQEKCILCGREFCLLCHKSTCFNNDVCKECEKRSDFKEIFNNFLMKFMRNASLELKQLSQLPKYNPKICSRCDGAFPKLYTFRFRNQIYRSDDHCRKVIKGELHEPSER